MTDNVSQGLPDNKGELENWLRRIDKELTRVGVSNTEVDSSTPRSNAGPQVTGVALVSNLNTITVSSTIWVFKYYRGITIC